MRRGKMNIIYGGQAGSEAKGKMGAYLVDKFDIRIVAGCLSPNAGHTVVKGGRKIVTHHIPASVAGGRKMGEMMVMMGPATVVKVDKLIAEIEMMKALGMNAERIYLDERAAIITQYHVRAEEGNMTVIGSTAQGVGEARADKIMRRGIMAKNSPVINYYCTSDTAAVVRKLMDAGHTIVYEMGQGFDLCIEHGVSPVYCTSRNCTPMQALADMGVPAYYLGDVYAVIRPYPIRVNNRTGSSGPYPSKEITWKEVTGRSGAPHDLTEYTTTTKLERRVFEFSTERIKAMVETCDPTYLCLQFANYIDWEQYRNTTLTKKVIEWIVNLEEEIKTRVAYVGTGPDHEDMIEMGVDSWN